ncbi:MAG: carbamoyl phosphate synthase small subunit [Spirochaetales bacterium]|nr:carbamoyl phosphate synthase small subunit [Spirochaetales bacterium]
MPDACSLILDDGTVFTGTWFGRKPPAAADLEGKSVGLRGAGEVVFNTAMSGYHEVLTDSSYTGQMVAMTYPHIGNYGDLDQWSEAGPEKGRSNPEVKPTALIVRKVYRGPVPEGRMSLDRFLLLHDTPGITGIDTRALTLKLRDEGSRSGVIISHSADDGPSDEELKASLSFLSGYPVMEGQNLVDGVGTLERQEGEFSLGEGTGAYELTGAGNRLAKGRPGRAAKPEAGSAGSQPAQTVSQAAAQSASQAAAQTVSQPAATAQPASQAAQTAPPASGAQAQPAQTSPPAQPTSQTAPPAQPVSKSAAPAQPASQTAAQPAATAQTASQPPAQPAAPQVALIDYGIKANIIREMQAAGARVVLYPSTAGAEEILEANHDAVLLSNGPGDPGVLRQQAEVISRLIGKIPVFGICLGHQLVAQAIGAETYKMKFGHHGVNHPVRDERTTKTFVTSQNHGFAVDEESLPSDAQVWFRNANDGSVEGLILENRRVLTTQFHPESAPGPHDGRWIFSRFLEVIDKE